MLFGGGRGGGTYSGGEEGVGLDVAAAQGDDLAELACLLDFVFFVLLGSTGTGPGTGSGGRGGDGGSAGGGSGGGGGPGGAVLGNSEDGEGLDGEEDAGGELHDWQRVLASKADLSREGKLEMGEK